MPANLMFFSEELIELNREVAGHPDLVEKLHQQDSPDMEVRLAVIAAYCNILLDGVYDSYDINKIAAKCIQILRARRTGIITLH